MKSSIEDKIKRELVFKTKGPFRVLKLILASAFAFLLGSREARKKSEEISGQDGKDTIHHGTSQ